MKDLSHINSKNTQFWYFLKVLFKDVLQWNSKEDDEEKTLK